MAHEKVYGICENKCRVEVPTKEETYNKGEIDNMIKSKANNNHNHDSRYYTESEVNDLLQLKANSSHVHDNRYYTEDEVDELIVNMRSEVDNSLADMENKTKVTLSDYIKTWSYTNNEQHTIPANSFKSIVIDVKWAGHTILGVIGVSAPTGTNIKSFNTNATTGRAVLTLNNPTDKDMTISGVGVDVLYVKNV